MAGDPVSSKTRNAFAPRNGLTDGNVNTGTSRHDHHNHHPGGNNAESINLKIQDNETKNTCNSVPSVVKCARGARKARREIRID